MKTVSRTTVDSTQAVGLPCLKEAGRDAILLSVHIQPKASRQALCGLHDDRLKIALTSPPVDGKANKALTVFLADLFGVSKSSIELQSGHTSRRKIVKISNIGYAEACNRLKDCLSG